MGLNTQIAIVCHEANRAYCQTIGDDSQKPWEEAEQWQRDSAIKGVEYAALHPDAPPSAQHGAWMEDKLAQGWKYGPVKDAAKKEHPCIMPYDGLPLEQRIKDSLFRGVVFAFLNPLAMAGAERAAGGSTSPAPKRVPRDARSHPLRRIESS